MTSRYVTFSWYDKKLSGTSAASLNFWVIHHYFRIPKFYFYVFCSRFEDLEIFRDITPILKFYVLSFVICYTFVPDRLLENF